MNISLIFQTEFTLFLPPGLKNDKILQHGMELGRFSIKKATKCKDKANSSKINLALSKTKMTIGLIQASY